MGQAGFTVAGQVIGSYFGPIGAIIGGAIGSAIGGALFPQQLPTQEGPRLDDLSVQSSSYGRPIPLVYGAARVAGNLIWSSGLRETRTSTELGGKGGGPTQEQVSYSYDVDCAIALCEGPIFAIRRIWINSTLVFDSRSTSDAQVQAIYGGNTDAILRALKESNSGVVDVTFYPGDSAQLADPTIEAAEGVGLAPAYRGTCYVVFTGLQLARWGNRIPQFEFEVISDGSLTPGVRVTNVGGVTPVFRYTGQSNNDALPVPIITDMTESIRVLSSTGTSVSSEVRIYGFDGTFKGADSRTDYEMGFTPLPVVGGTGVINIWTMFDGARLYFNRATSELQIQGGVTAFGESTAVLVSFFLPGYFVFGGCAVAPDGRHFMALHAGGASDDITEWFLIRYDATGIEILDSGTFNNASGYLAKRSLIGTSPTSQLVSQYAACMLEGDLKTMWRAYDSRIEVWQVDKAGTMSMIQNFVSPGPYSEVGGDAPMALHCDDGLCAFVAGAATGTESRLYVFSRIPALSTTSLTVGTIVTRLCLLAGLTVSDIDVTELTAVCIGFRLGASTSARSAIESLMRAYNFDAAESGGKIIFRGRAGAVAATLVEEDLGAGAEVSDGPLVESVRAQETELPNEVSVSYFSLAADYQVAAQAARRSATDNEQKEQIQLPVVLTDDDAAKAADRLLYQAWIARNERTFSTTVKWAHLEPTDVVQLSAAPVAATARLTGRRQSGGVVTWTAVDTNPIVLDSAAIGSSPPLPSGIAAVAQSRVEVLDIPALRSIDDDAGVYVAIFTTANGSWPGAALLRADSRDGPYERIASIYLRGTVGAARTLLGTFNGNNTFDESSTVDIQLFSGALASATELAVLNGANAALVGREIIQFKTVTSLGGDLYRLSGLLRGRRATEQYISTHALNERFVLLTDGGIDRLPMPIGAIGKSYLYQPITFGGRQNHVYDERVVHAGTSKLPAPPCNLVGVRRTDGVVFTWQRRDRLAWEWQDSIELPLNEAQERYTLEILDAGGVFVVRTFNDIPSGSLLYRIADEQLDFPIAYPNATLNVRLCQVSATVGRGIPLVKTVTGLINL